MQNKFLENIFSRIGHRLLRALRIKFDFYNETYRAFYTRIVGIFLWFLTSLLAILLGNAELFGAAGSLGIASLFIYIFFEKEYLTEESASWKKDGDRLEKDLNRLMKEKGISEEDDNDKAKGGEEVQSLIEAVSDYRYYGAGFQDSLEKVKFYEVLIFVTLTLQWGFGSLLYKLVVKIL